MPPSQAAAQRETQELKQPHIESTPPRPPVFETKLQYLAAQRVCCLPKLRHSNRKSQTNFCTASFTQQAAKGDARSNIRTRDGHFNTFIDIKITPSAQCKRSELKTELGRGVRAVINHLFLFNYCLRNK